MMAIANGNISTDATESPKYVGVGVCKVIGFNPTKAQYKELLGYEPNNEPAYVGVQEVQGKNIPFARISFVVKTIPELSNDIETTQLLTFFIRNQYRVGSQSGKFQVIDEYGRTAWADKATIDAHAQIMYSNGPAQISQNYRPLYVGEEALTTFIKALVNIPDPATYQNGAWVMKSSEELKECYCRLDDIPNYFKGNFKEIKDTLALRPDNKIKVVFGIRTTDSGQEYQDLYNEMVLKSSSNNITKIQKEIEDRQANGALSNRYYEYTPLHEYKVEPTDVSTPAQTDDPFANAESTSWPANQQN